MTRASPFLLFGMMSQLRGTGPAGDEARRAGLRASRRAGAGYFA